MAHGFKDNYEKVEFPNAVVKDSDGNVDIEGNETVGGDETVNGNILVDGYLTMRTNNQAISFKDASDHAQTHPMVYISPSNYFGLGYGMYNSNKGETRIYGDTLRMYSHNPITTNQDMEIGGSLTVDGHSSPIGTILEGTRASTAGNVGTTYSTVASVDVTAGKWIIVGYNSFNGGSAGSRRIIVTSDSSATGDASQGSSSTYISSDSQIVLRSTIFASVSNTATFYLRAKSSTQVTSPYGNIFAMRIA